MECKGELRLGFLLTLLFLPWSACEAVIPAGPLYHQTVPDAPICWPGKASLSQDSMSLPVTNLAVVRDLVLNYLSRLQKPDMPYGAYRYTPGDEPGFYSTTDVAIMRTIMGEDLHRSLSRKQRRAWIDYINSYANEDGTYQGGRHADHHRNGMAIGALGPLGGSQLYPVRFYGDFDELDEIGPWLENIDWENQWAASHYFWGGIHCYSLSKQCTPAWLDATFQWLDRHLDPETGWWKIGVPHADSNQPLGGGAHIWPIYQHHDRRFPYPEKVIDRIIELQKEDGTWLLFPRYLDLDALYGLAYMQKLAPGYRTADIKKAAIRHARVALDQYRDYLASEPDTHLLLSMVGTFGLLQQLLPDYFYDEVKWTDIFSDLRLYQTHKVERTH